MIHKKMTNKRQKNQRFSSYTFFLRKNRKGELTTKQLVVIIVLIVSFIVILFLFFRLNLGGTTNEEICRNSVILKSKAGVLTGPLDCRTNYLCISEGKDCKNLSSASKLKVKNEKQEIMKVLADEMVGCWWMFGEGKADYAGGAVFSKTACAVCSILEFDEKIQSGGKISYEEFYDYLKNTKKTNTQTYFQYLYGAGSLESLKTDFPVQDYLNNEIDFSKSYFIVTGMSKKVFGFWESKHLPVIMLEKIPENYDAVGCDDFLTKS